MPCKAQRAGEGAGGAGTPTGCHQQFSCPALSRQGCESTPLLPSRLSQVIKPPLLRAGFELVQREGLEVRRRSWAEGHACVAAPARLVAPALAARSLAGTLLPCSCAVQMASPV